MPRRADRPDARAGPGDLRPGLQRHRESHPVVHRPPALRHREGARRSATCGPGTGRRTRSTAPASRRRSPRRRRPNAKVLIQDYHLVLTPAAASRAASRPARISHFTHTPWARPDYFRMLPDPVARQILRGMLGADLLGFPLPAVGRRVPRLLRGGARGVGRGRSGRPSRAGRPRRCRCSRLGSTVWGCVAAPRPPTSRAGCSC